jgi:predicted GNAT family acetyltransferase
VTDAQRTPVITDDTAHSRFVCVDGDAVAELIYEIDGDRMILIHTGVPDAFRGRGVGGALVTAALDRARAAGLTVLPWCPFARRWLREHPDVAGTVAIDWTPPPPSPA